MQTDTNKKIIHTCESGGGNKSHLVCSLSETGGRVYEILPGGGSIGVKTIAQAQHGALPEKGVNGFMVEHFIAAAKNELEEFQRSPLPCAENHEALEHLDKALGALGLRTKRRLEQGVEGKHELHETPAGM